MDWDLGRYESVADQLEPAARAVVMAVDEMRGQRLLDIGCGTGNGATLAARRGARVIGIDPAARLLAVARDRAISDQLPIEYRAGRAESLEFDDDSFDVVLSIFALIFASDPHLAASEIRRVLVPGGHLAFCTWLADSPLATARRDIIQQALGGDPGPTAFAWHDPVTVNELMTTHSLEPSFREVGLKFVAPSTRSFVDTEWEINPVWFAARQALVDNDLFDEVDAALMELLDSSNEEVGRFAVTSPFLVVTATALATS